LRVLLVLRTVVAVDVAATRKHVGNLVEPAIAGSNRQPGVHDRILVRIANLRASRSEELELPLPVTTNLSRTKIADLSW